MGLFSGLLDFLENATPIGLLETGLDSLGLTRHGRDQYFNRSMQQDFLNQQFAFQREQTQNQQDFTRQMYDLQWNDMLTKYPELQRRLNNQNFNLWRQQQNFQNAYNSPQNQVALQMAAGINPNSPFSQSVGTANLGATSPSQPPQISPTPFTSHASPIGLPTGFSQPSQMVRDVGGFLKDMAQAKQLGVQTDQLEKLFDLEVEERTQRIFGQRLTNDSISLANYVSNLTKDTKVRKATEDLLKVVAETKNIDAETLVELEKVFTERSTQLLNVAKSHLSDKEFELVSLRVKNFNEEFRTTMANLRADTSKKVSESRLNNALRETENQLRDGRVKSQDLANNAAKIGNELLGNDLYISNRTLDSKLNSLIHTYEREGIYTKQEAEKLYQLQVSSDYAERQQFIQYVGATCQAVGNILGGAGSAFSGVASYKNAQWNNLNYKERNDITREIGRERNRILDEYQKQNISARRSAVLGPDWEMYSDQWHK